MRSKRSKKQIMSDFFAVLLGVFFLCSEILNTTASPVQEEHRQYQRSSQVVGSRSNG